MSTFDLEEQVLLALLQAPVLAPEGAVSIGPDDFARRDRRALYVALIRAAESSAGGSLDLDALAESLTDPELADAESRAAALELLARLIEAMMSGAVPGSGDGGAGSTAERFRFNVRRMREMAEIRGALASAPASGTGGSLPVTAHPRIGGAADSSEAMALSDIEARLRVAKRLRDQELITEEEYAAKRKELLAAL